MKHAAIVILVGLLALAGGIALRFGLYPAPSTEEIPLPAFDLPDLDGKPHAIDEWKGSVRVLNFWATWCPSCREEIPGLVALQEQYADKGVQLIGIALEDKEPVADYIDFFDINYPTLIAGEQGMALAQRLGNRAEAIPFTVVVDKEGIIRYRHLGKIEQGELAEMIEGFQ